MDRLCLELRNVVCCIAVKEYPILPFHKVRELNWAKFK